MIVQVNYSKQKEYFIGAHKLRIGCNSENKMLSYSQLEK
jgi:hypothetical protein